MKEKMTFADFIFGTLSSLLGSIIHEKTNNAIVTTRLKNIFKESVEQLGDKKAIKDITELSLHDTWEQISKYPEIKNAVATKLINDPKLHISYLAFYAQTLKNEFNGTRQIIEKDLRHDLSDPEDFFKLYPSSAYSIEDLFIEPIYHVFESEENRKEMIDNNKTSKIEETCKNILEEQKLLLLMGPYGSGKTVLSKHLISKISDGLCIYIQANRLPNDLNGLFTNEAIETLTNSYKKVYIFLDACENYFIVNANGWEIIQSRISKFTNLRFVINMRKPNSVVLSDLLETINIYFEKIKYIELSYFEKDQVKQWLALYHNQSVTMNRKIHVTDDDIIQNKYLQSTCYNPLMLAMMAEPDSSYDLKKDSGWYNLFEDFVRKTIRGKFYKDKNRDSFLLKLTKEYRDFVYELAIETLKQPQLKFSYEEENLDLFILDSNEENYPVEQKLIDEKLTKNLKQEIEKQKRIQYLNCFFFEYEEFSGEWRFRDNNILYFLCADKIYNNLIDLITFCKKGDSGKLVEKFKGFIREFDSITIHPVILDFLLDAIRNARNESGYNERDYIELIKKLIDENLIINFPKDKSFCLDYNKIKIDILLSVVFLKYNKSYSKQRGLSHYFKNISHYYSIIKIVDDNLSSILRRYFRTIVVNEVEFRRINLKGFNWNGSTMENVKYIQCKFQDTSMDDMTFNEVSFEQCYFRKNKINNYSGNIDFRLCQIQESFFSSKKTHILSFKNCIINNFTLNCDKRLILTFECCSINNLKINSKSSCISISDCNLIGKIHLSNTKAYFYKPNEIDTIKKWFDSDNAERYIITISEDKECSKVNRCYITNQLICKKIENEL